MHANERNKKYDSTGELSCRFSRLWANSTVVTAIAALSIAAPPASAADFFKSLDFQIDKLDISGVKKELVLEGTEYVPKFQVVEGKTVTVSCDWSAALAPGIKYVSTDVEHFVQIVIKRDAHAFAFGPAKILAGTKVGSKEIENESILGTGIGGSSTTQHFDSPMKGSLTGSWTAAGVGLHKLECVIPKSQFTEPTLSNNIAYAFLDVVPTLNLSQFRKQQNWSFEAEQLARSNQVSVFGGQAVVQPMSSFGQGWSGNEQLFWRGGAQGSSIDLKLNIPAAGLYSLTLDITRAPDYGDFIVKVNGQPSNTNVVGYGPFVMAPTAVQMGNFQLQAGINTLKLTIIGKSQQSSGYFVGIDRIRLTPEAQ